jgi:hypothetical protein
MTSFPKTAILEHSPLEMPPLEWVPRPPGSRALFVLRPDGFQELAMEGPVERWQADERTLRTATGQPTQITRSTYMLSMTAIIGTFQAHEPSDQTRG